MGGLCRYDFAVNGKLATVVVCDSKSGPGGRPKGLGAGKSSPSDWGKMLMACNFKSDAEALAHRGNPVNNLAPIARAKVPFLQVDGDADTVVHRQENTGVVAECFRELGGSITLSPKP